MAQLSDDCFAFGGAMLALDDAMARIAALHDCVVGTRAVPLAAACGAVLAEDVMAGVNVPPEDNSAVDGYAVHFDDLAPDRPTVLPVLARTAAGAAPAVVPRGAAGRIFTGAPMPDGPDTVMMQEDCVETADGVLIQPGIRRGANRRRAGEDVATGDVVLRAGQRLGPPHVGLLAAIGRAEIAVRAPVRVALFSTGDELVEPPSPTGGGRIYDANRAMLAALLRNLGAEVIDGGILRDDPVATEAALRSSDADLIVTSGGVSAGEEDHLRAAIEAAGRLEFWRVAIKPGRPVTLGAIGATPLLGLPGNPVAALVVFSTLGRVLLARLGGAELVPLPEFAMPAGFAYRKKAGRTEFVRVMLRDGVAHRHPKEGAGVITSLTGSDGLMRLPPALERLEPGDAMPVIPMGALHG